MSLGYNQILTQKYKQCHGVSYGHAQLLECYTSGVYARQRPVVY